MEMVVDWSPGEGPGACGLAWPLPSGRRCVIRAESLPGRHFLAVEQGLMLVTGKRTPAVGRRLLKEQDLGA